MRLAIDAIYTLHDDRSQLHASSYTPIDVSYTTIDADRRQLHDDRHQLHDDRRQLHVLRRLPPVTRRSTPVTRRSTPVTRRSPPVTRQWLVDRYRRLGTFYIVARFASSAFISQHYPPWLKNVSCKNLIFIYWLIVLRNANANIGRYQR